MSAHPFSATFVLCTVAPIYDNAHAASLYIVMKQGSTCQLNKKQLADSEVEGPPRAAAPELRSVDAFARHQAPNNRTNAQLYYVLLRVAFTVRCRSGRVLCTMAKHTRKKKAQNKLRLAGTARHRSHATPRAELPASLGSLSF